MKKPITTIGQLLSLYKKEHRFILSIIIILFGIFLILSLESIISALNKFEILKQLLYELTGLRKF